MNTNRILELCKSITNDTTQDDDARELARLVQSDMQRLIAAIGGLQARCNDLERSANSAREIARVAMSNTGTTAIRVELVQTDYGLNLVLCAPASDEIELTRRMMALLNPAVINALGVDVEKDPNPIGATG